MKNALRYAALAMTMISSTALLSDFLRLLGAYSFAQHRFVSTLDSPFDTLFAAVTCFGFGRSYQLLGRSKLDATSKTQTEIELRHMVYLLTWFCLLFMVHKMNRPQRIFPPGLLVALVLATAVAIWSGFVLRKTLLKKSADALPDNVGEALKHWKGAYLIGFNNALCIAIFGAALKFVGSSWQVAGIFFGLSLGFLLLWGPRHTATSSAQLA